MFAAMAVNPRVPLLFILMAGLYNLAPYLPVQCRVATPQPAVTLSADHRLETSAAAAARPRLKVGSRTLGLPPLVQPAGCVKVNTGNSQNCSRFPRRGLDVIGSDAISPRSPGNSLLSPVFQMKNPIHHLFGGIRDVVRGTDTEDDDDDDEPLHAVREVTSGNEPLQATTSRSAGDETRTNRNDSQMIGVRDDESNYPPGGVFSVTGGSGPSLTTTSSHQANLLDPNQRDSHAITPDHRGFTPFRATFTTDRFHSKWWHIMKATETALVNVTRTTTSSDTDTSSALPSGSSYSTTDTGDDQQTTRSPLTHFLHIFKNKLGFHRKYTPHLPDTLVPTTPLELTTPESSGQVDLFGDGEDSSREGGSKREESSLFKKKLGFRLKSKPTQLRLPDMTTTSWGLTTAESPGHVDRFDDDQGSSREGGSKRAESSDLGNGNLTGPFTVTSATGISTPLDITISAEDNTNTTDGYTSNSPLTTVQEMFTFNHTTLATPTMQWNATWPSQMVNESAEIVIPGIVKSVPTPDSQKTMAPTIGDADMLTTHTPESMLITGRGWTMTTSTQDTEIRNKVTDEITDGAVPAADTAHWIKTGARRWRTSSSGDQSTSTSSSTSQSTDATRWPSASTSKLLVTDKHPAGAGRRSTASSSSFARASPPGVIDESTADNLHVTAKQSRRLSGGKIVGIFIGTVASIAILGTAAFYVYRRRRVNRSEEIALVEQGASSNASGTMNPSFNLRS